MAQIPKGRLVKGPHKPICRDCAIYFSTTVMVKVGVDRCRWTVAQVQADLVLLVLDSLQLGSLSPVRGRKVTAWR